MAREQLLARVYVRTRSCVRACAHPQLLACMKSAPAAARTNQQMHASIGAPAQHTSAEPHCHRRGCTQRTRQRRSDAAVQHMMHACLASQVKAAMNDINAETRLRAAALQRAEAAKIRVVKEAEAEAEAKYLAGAGVARQRQVRGHAAAQECRRMLHRRTGRPRRCWLCCRMRARVAQPAAHAAPHRLWLQRSRAARCMIEVSLAVSPP